MDIIFRKLPKPANLHIHWSGIVSYDKIMCELVKHNLHNQVMISSEGYLSFIKENPKDTYRKMTLSDVEKYKKTSRCSDFDQMNQLGKTYYGIIKYFPFYKHYVKLILRYRNN